MLLDIFIVLLLVSINGFFVAAEFALVKVKKTDFRELFLTGDRRAKLLDHIIGHLDGYLSACQLGITLASLGLGWVGEPMVAQSLGPIFKYFSLPEDKVHFISFPLAFAAITFLHITLGEQVPKIMAIQRHRPTAYHIAIPLEIFMRIFRYFIWIINSSSNLMLRLIGITMTGEHKANVSEDELRLLLRESQETGNVSVREQDIIENVLDLEDKIARRHMIPRHKVVCLMNDRSIKDNINLAAQSNHSRFPFCDGDLDSTVGIVHIKDLFRVSTSSKPVEDLKKLARPAVIIPESIRLDALLRRFLKARQHMLLLVDDYGAVSGMITLEDVLEELVGTIKDEFDDEEVGPKNRSDGTVEVPGSFSIDHLGSLFGQGIIDSPVDTVAGLVTKKLDRMPVAGDKVTHQGLYFKILKADEKSVHWIRVSSIEKEESNLISSPEAVSKKKEKKQGS